MGFPILVRWHLYIEMAHWWLWNLTQCSHGAMITHASNDGVPCTCALPSLQLTGAEWLTSYVGCANLPAITSWKIKKVKTIRVTNSLMIIAIFNMHPMQRNSKLIGQPRLYIITLKTEQNAVILHTISRDNILNNKNPAKIRCHHFAKEIVYLFDVKHMNFD